MFQVFLTVNTAGHYSMPRITQTLNWVELHSAKAVIAQPKLKLAYFDKVNSNISSNSNQDKRAYLSLH